MRCACIDTELTESKKLIFTGMSKLPWQPSLPSICFDLEMSTWFKKQIFNSDQQLTSFSVSLINEKFSFPAVWKILTPCKIFSIHSLQLAKITSPSFQQYFTKQKIWKHACNRIIFDSERASQETKRITHAVQCTEIFIKCGLLVHLMIDLFFVIKLIWIKPLSTEAFWNKMYR